VRYRNNPLLCYGDVNSNTIDWSYILPEDASADTILDDEFATDSCESVSIHISFIIRKHIMHYLFSALRAASGMPN